MCMTVWLVAWVAAMIVAQEATYARNGRGLTSQPDDRSQPLLIVTFLVAMGCCLAAAVRGWGASPAWQASFTGQGLFLLAWVWRMAAIRQLGRHFTAHVAIADDQPLIDTGTYRFIRHPGYLGVIGAVAGCALMTGSVPGWLALLVGYVPAVIYRIRVEERVLAERMGAPFAAYQARTWRLLPFCY
jgi:protein-S-isoprenylcysteine O-methyltransferase Ste14